MPTSLRTRLSGGVSLCLMATLAIMRTTLMGAVALNDSLVWVGWGATGLIALCHVVVLNRLFSQKIRIAIVVGIGSVTASIMMMVLGLGFFCGIYETIFKKSPGLKTLIAATGVILMIGFAIALVRQTT